MRSTSFVPGAHRLRRLRLDFASRVGRMGTPESHVQAIRSLHGDAPEEVVRALEIEADGSFTLDSMSLDAAPA